MISVMNIHLYIFITSLILVIITIILLISLFTKYNLKKVNDIGVLITLFIFSSFLYINKQYSSIFSKNINYSNLFYWSGLLLFCYAYFISFIDSIQYSSIHFLILSILFLIGSCLYILNSVVNKTYTIDNQIFSLYDSIFYTISALYYVFYYFSNNFSDILIGVILFLIGRFITLYIAYNNLITKEETHIKLN